MPSKKNTLINELEAAVEAGSIAKVRAALDKVPEGFKYERGRTPLHIAAHAGKTKIVEFLLGQKPDLDASDYRGSTPLHLAAAGGHVATVRLLLDAGAAVAIEDTYGEVPLHKVARGLNRVADRTKAATALLEADCPVDHGNLSGQTPLHFAAQTGNLALVELLLSRGAAPDATAAGQIGTPKDAAEQNAHSDVAKLIAARMAD